MTDLKHIRRQLHSLGRARLWNRRGMAYAALIAAAIACLLTLFALDVVFDLRIGQRLLLLSISLAFVSWAAWRYAVPHLGQRETEIDLALMVEREHDISSDLVAALQFESGGESDSSSQLKQAVIKSVSSWSRGLDPFAGMDRWPLTKRLLMAGAAILVAGLVAFGFPDHARVFGNRLLLGSRHYPTHTRIANLSINGHSVDLRARPQIRIPLGAKVTFDVEAAGKRAPYGKVELRSLTGETMASVALRDRLPSEGSAAKQQAFIGTLPRLTASANFRLFLGDAWTETLLIQAIHVPTADVRLRITPPRYARPTVVTPVPNSTATGGNAQDSGLGTVVSDSPHAQVIERSQVAIEVHSLNKQVDQMTLVLTEGDRQQKYEMRPRDSASEGSTFWSVENAGTPLAAVVRPLKYSIQAVDRDGLSFEKPLTGSIRIKKDQLPQVDARLVHKVVVPNAKPVVDFRVDDDFGVRSLQVRVTLRRADKTENDVRVVPSNDLPVAGQQLPWTGRYVLPLADYDLQKGDRVTVVLEAADQRGDRENAIGRSKPIELTISDAGGVLAAISKTDEEVEKSLTAIIQQQLGIGVSP